MSIACVLAAVALPAAVFAQAGQPGPLTGLASLTPSFPRREAAPSSLPRHLTEKWHQNIVTTVFWVGEPSVGAGWSACKDSAWDPRWVENYGGPDHPTKRKGFLPAAFKPKQNPFYVALPFNDLVPKTRANPVISNFLRFWRRSVIGSFRNSKSVCKNQWIAIRFGDKVVHAQWQDVGPVNFDDYDYVFGFQRPKSTAQGMAGLDVSPAVRDFLGIPGRGTTDWRFVDETEVPRGPWKDIVTRD
ncbi:MAG: hypothetical protein JO317_09300 [Verrucomicrobiae bacterium]|nr:hypothetical protein [Verrucomicrobiae bacterium]